MAYNAPPRAMDIHPNTPEFEKSKDRSFKPNWIILDKFVRANLQCRKNHVRVITNIKRKRKECTPLMDLMYDLRLKAIVVAYFPYKDHYKKIWHSDLSNHTAYQTQVLWTNSERSIVEGFEQAIKDLRKDPKNTKNFNDADMLFGMYRYEKWLERLDN